MKFDIVICTYNRANILKITLPSYDALHIPKDITLEIIIVDNNSNDETGSYVKEFIEQNKSEISYRYIREPEQGLSYARNTGYRHASGEYIAYTDDECILPEDWLEVSMKHIRSIQPAFLGGPFYGKYMPKSSSSWYKESFGDSYILQYNVPNGPMSHRFLSGGNLIIRKDVFDKVGLFDTELGMNGETINYGEEQDFQRRLRTSYPEEIIYYDSELFVWHFIRDEKMSISYLFNEALVRGVSSAKVAHNSFLRLLISPLLLLFYVLRASLSAVLRWLESLFSKEHFYTLLHDDYVSNVWRSIGGSWYRSKLLFSYMLFKSRVRTSHND